MFQRAQFDFTTFLGVLKTWKHCSLIICRENNRDMMNAGMEREFIDVKQLGEIRGG